MFSLRAFLSAKIVLNSNKKIHESMLESIIRAPQSYFDVTPDGEILNKVSNDLNVLDGSLVIILN